MLSHVLIGCNDPEKSRSFYDKVLATIRIPPAKGPDRHGHYWWMTPDKGLFGIGKPIDGQEATHGNGTTIGFLAPDPPSVIAFHDVGLANGGTSIEDPPGDRDGTYGRLCLAYLRDPDGNKLCALHRYP